METRKRHATPSRARCHPRSWFSMLYYKLEQRHGEGAMKYSTDHELLKQGEIFSKGMPSRNVRDSQDTRVHFLCGAQASLGVLGRVTATSLQQVEAVCFSTLADETCTTPSSYRYCIRTYGWTYCAIISITLFHLLNTLDCLCVVSSVLLILKSEALAICSPRAAIAFPRSL